jgi:hypothetical protein
VRLCPEAVDTGHRGKQILRAGTRCAAHRLAGCGVWFGVGLIFNWTDLARILGCSTELANCAVSLMCLAELVQLALGLTRYHDGLPRT